MPSPQTVLPWLLGGTLGAAGILQGLHWKATLAPANPKELENQLRSVGEQIEMLRRENESLRSLAQGGGELSVPREFIDRTEKNFGLRFLSSPVIHRIAREELRDRIAAAIESRMGPSGIEDRQRSYQLIGWLRPDDHLLTQLTAVRSVGASGWFDDVTGEGWMLDRADLKNIPDQATLIGLLARVLFHQHFPPTPAHPGDDAARAREALHQGTAAAAEARFYAEKARNSGFIPMKKNTEFKQLLASLPPFVQGLTRFPQLEGKGFADSLYLQGNEKLQDAFRNPPQTTRAIISPDQPAAAPGALEAPATAEEPFLNESAGQLGLRLWLQPLGEADIADNWKGDRYLLFPDGDSSTAIIWDIELASAEATDRLQACALQLAAALAESKQHAAVGDIIPSPGKRHLAVVRVTPTRLRFLNTAEASTTARFGNP